MYLGTKLHFHLTTARMCSFTLFPHFFALLMHWITTIVGTKDRRTARLHAVIEQRYTNRVLLSEDRHSLAIVFAKILHVHVYMHLSESGVVIGMQVAYM